MGCHTWFYRKVNDVTYEKSKENLIKNLQSYIETNSRLLLNPSKEDLDFLQYYPEYTKEYLQKEINVFKRQIQMVESGYCKEAVISKGSGYLYIRGKGCYNSLNWCDIFRIGGYPEHLLFSLDETLEFIEQNKDKIHSYHYNEISKKGWKEQLEDFWKEYPDGMISFG